MTKTKETSFADLLANYQGGILDMTLGRELKSLTQAVEKQGKKGTMAINIELKPAGNGKMELVFSYNSKPPVDNISKGMMYIDDDKNLVATDPEQQSLPLRVIGVEEQKVTQKREAI